jgi:hypothetical protein
MDWLVMMMVIVSMETGGDPINMIGDHGQALGIVQIHMEIVAEYNSDHGTFYSHTDVRNPNLSITITRWYLKKWKKNYERITGKQVTPDILYRIWNGGPSGWKKTQTEKLGNLALVRYNKFQSMDRKEQLKLYNHWIRAFKDVQIPNKKIPTLEEKMEKMVTTVASR